MVPKGVPALTKRGWLMYNEIVPNEDETLARDVDGKLVWVPILEVQESEAEPIWLLDAPQAVVRTTEHHQWIIGRRGWRRIIYESHDLKKFLDNDEIAVSGLYQSEHDDIEPTIARLYGLVVAGRADWRVREGEWTLHIRQTDSDSRDYILDTLSGIPYRKYRMYGSNIYVVNEKTTKKISKLYEESIEESIWRMSSLARHAFLEGIFGESYLEPVTWELALAAFLNDRMVQRRPYNRVKNGTIPLKTATFEPTGEEMPVWCPRTELGTWTMFQHDTPMITGG